MIYLVDEDFSAFGAWIAELVLRKHPVQPLLNADEAFRLLCQAAPEQIDLVVIDVMLAVEDPRVSRFGEDRTDDYLETGLRLLEDLAEQNPVVFPRRAVLLTNTTNDATFNAAQRTSSYFRVPFWQKSTIFSPVEFADRVEKLVSELSTPA